MGASRGDGSAPGTLRARLSNQTERVCLGAGEQFPMVPGHSLINGTKGFRLGPFGRGLLPRGFRLFGGDCAQGPGHMCSARAAIFPMNVHPASPVVTLDYTRVSYLDGITGFQFLCPSGEGHLAYAA